MQPDSPAPLPGRRSRRGTVVAALAGVSALALIGALTLANGGGAPSAAPPAAGSATTGPLRGTAGTATPPATQQPVGTILPAEGTALPALGAAIEPGNATQVQALAQWGKGTVTKAVYAPDGRTIALASSLEPVMHFQLCAN